MSPATLLSLLNHALWNPVFWSKISTVCFLITCNFVSCLKYWYCCICIGNAASLMLSVEDYPPGDYNLTIEVIDVFGQIQVRSYSFFLPGEFACIAIIVDIVASLSLSLAPLSLPPLSYYLLTQHRHMHTQSLCCLASASSILVNSVFSVTHLWIIL